MAKKMLFLFVLLLSLTGMLKAQVTTAGMSGKVMADEESVIGATVVAVHEPSGTSYGTVTNVDGRFSLQGMRSGGPYKVTVSTSVIRRQSIQVSSCNWVKLIH